MYHNKDMVNDPILNKKCQQLHKKYAELLKIFTDENDKLDTLLPPVGLPNGKLAEWYNNSENKTKLHDQFKLLKELRLDLNKAWKAYLECLKEYQ